VSTGNPLLLVDDDPLVLFATEELLTDGGFKLETAANGTEAITKLEDPSFNFCALVTDVRMPGGPSGWDVAHRARELFPAMPVVYVTGDSALQWAAHGVPGSVLISKPYVQAQIITALATLLNKASVGGPT
jgi:CheY-like chemotaxis protein